MKREAEEDWRRRSDAENDVRPREGTERTLQECERSPMTVWPSVADRPLRPYRSAHFGPRFAWIPTAPIDTREEITCHFHSDGWNRTGRQFILQAARLSSEGPLCVRFCVYKSITARGR
jgi:hypothetical protein